MARTYLSDTVESTWEVPEHQTFANLADRMEDYLASQPAQMNERVDDKFWGDHEFEPESIDCLMGWCNVWHG